MQYRSGAFYEDVVWIVEALPVGSERAGARPGRKIAHLLFDGAWVMAPSALVGGESGDLGEHGGVHAPLLVRGKRRRKREGCAGSRPPPRGRTGRRDRGDPGHWPRADRKSTRLNSSHANISYAVFCLKN